MRLASIPSIALLALALPLLAVAAPSQARNGIASTDNSDTGVRIHGTLRGLDGAALDGIEIQLYCRGSRRDRAASLPYLDSSHRVKLAAPIRTDGEGGFVIQHSIDAARDYLLCWSEDGVETGSSGWLTASDLEAALELSAVARRPFFGRLLDQDQQPVEEAEIRVRREGAAAVKTNAQGEFRLPLVSERSEPLVIRLADGHLDKSFDWALVGGGDGWKDVVIGRGALTPSPRPPLPSASVLHGLASDLRARALEVAIRHRHYIQFRWRLLALARVDLPAALRRLGSQDLDEWFEGLTPAHFHNQSTCGSGYVCYDSIVREGVNLREYIGAQLRVAADGSDETARSNFEALTTGDRPSLLLGMRLGFPKLASEANDEGVLERARRTVAEAADKHPGNQVRIYTRAALELLDADHDEEAAEVMSKATAIVAPGKTSSFLNDGYIHALCRFDLDAGLELIRAQKKDNDRYTGLMTEAVRLAPELPRVAIGLLHEAEAIPVPRYSSLRSRFWVSRFVYGLSEKDLAAAEALARRYDPSGYSLGLVALFMSRQEQSAKVGQEPERVRRLLDAAYGFAESEASPSQRSRSVAGLLEIARLADPSGLQAWLARTLWNSTPDNSAATAEAFIAWTLRDYAPELASSMIFSTLGGAAVDHPFGGMLWGAEHVWSVATFFDPVQSAAAAVQEGGAGLEEAANALEEKSVGPGSFRAGSLGLWWPRD